MWSPRRPVPAKPTACLATPRTEPALRTAGPSLAFLELVRLLFERFVARRLRGQDPIEILDLFVLLVVLEIFLEIEVLADERAFRVRAQVGRLGRRREADLAVVA